MGVFGEDGRYHPAEGEYMRHKATGKLVRMWREVTVNGKQIIIGREDTGASGDVALSGPISDFEFLDIPEDPYNR